MYRKHRRESNRITEKLVRKSRPKAAGNVSVSAKSKFMANICVQSARRRRNEAWRPWPQPLAMPKKNRFANG